MKTKQQPLTLTVTLPPRKAAALRRMSKYDGVTEQESIERAIYSDIASFLEVEASHREDRKRERAGLPPKPEPAFHVAPDTLDLLADKVTAKMAEPETIEVELPREEIAKLAALAAAAGESLNEFVVRSIADILDCEGITKAAIG